MTEISRKYSTDADKTLEKIKETCNRLGLPIVNEDATTRRIQVSTGWTAFSWGEIMDIIVSQQKDGATVTVDSKPKVWYNLPGSERAKRNAKALLDELEKQV
jgi:hypothetical protein